MLRGLARMALASGFSKEEARERLARFAGEDSSALDRVLDETYSKETLEEARDALSRVAHHPESETNPGRAPT